MNTRLFQITDIRTRKPLKDEHFDNKAAAKERRRVLNEQEQGFRYYVSPGPDHRKYRK